MSIKKYFSLLIILASIFLAACALATSPVVTPQGMPDIGIPLEQLNNDIGLSAPQGWNTYKAKDSIYLLMQPISQQIIIFSVADTRTFLYDNGKWVELKDKTILEPPDLTFILDPAQGFGHDGSSAVTVDLPDPNKPALLRIFVIGYVYENGAKTDKKVASYIDVNLTP